MASVARYRIEPTGPALFVTNRPIPDSRNTVSVRSTLKGVGVICTCESVISSPTGHVRQGGLVAVAVWADAPGGVASSEGAPDRAELASADACADDTVAVRDVPLLDRHDKTAKPLSMTAQNKAMITWLRFIEVRTERVGSKRSVLTAGEGRLLRALRLQTLPHGGAVARRTL